MNELTPEAHLDVLLRAHRTVALRLTQIFAEAGTVPPSEARVLTYISKADDHRMRIDALSQELGMTKSAVSRIVDRLERAGYVQRLKSGDDRRGIYAAMTPDGRDALRHVTRVFRSVFDEVFLTGLDREELNQMSALLAKLDQAIRPARQTETSESLEFPAFSET